MKLLIIEDNPRLADRVHRQLHKIYSLDMVDNGHEALIKAKNTDYGVILLDLGLPDISGLEVCKQLRSLRVSTPILVLTGTDNNKLRVELLNAGADDYVTKPFDSGVLKARVAALARRRARQSPRTIITYKDIVMDIDQRRVTRAGVPIDLRRKEFDILEYLISNSGRIMTRDMIMNHAWDGDKISWSTTVDVHIKHLRDKIDRPFDSHIIKTAYGLGYRIDPPDVKH